MHASFCLYSTRAVLCLLEFESSCILHGPPSGQEDIKALYELGMACPVEKRRDLFDDRRNGKPIDRTVRHKHMNAIRFNSKQRQDKR
jgi:hypothetical protein